MCLCSRFPYASLTTYRVCSYPITMASWCPEENMGDCGKLVLKFNEDVAAEGLDIDTDQLILLEEAIAGGWSE